MSCVYADTLKALSEQLESLQADCSRLDTNRAIAQQAAITGQAAVAQLTKENDALAGTLSALTAEKVRSAGPPFRAR